MEYNENAAHAPRYAAASGTSSLHRIRKKTAKQSGAAIKIAGSVGMEAKEFVYELKFADKTTDEKAFVEDLWARRDELRQTLSQIDLSNAELRDILKRKIRKRFLSFGYLLRQYIRRENLTEMLADAREEFREDAERLSDTEARAEIDRIVALFARLAGLRPPAS